MMDQHERSNEIDEIMLPGFRFHPTDEELVGFYLKKKIQQRPLSIELIKQLDIYKYDPWDLPKLATTGEKEWYFYCPRDRKYRNSARPNRVTGAGFWKATGTDRPIYSSEGNKCIGLKKSLVFYKGRAAKGIKTDWMMHEFRLPSLADSSSGPPKRYFDKNIPPNDSWAICKIFKKTNSTAQRALSQSWVSPLPDPCSSSDHIVKGSQSCSNGFSSPSILTTETSNSAIHFYNNTATTASNTAFSSSPFDRFSSYKLPLNNVLPLISKPSNGNLFFETMAPPKCSSSSSVVDVSSMLLNMSSSMLSDFGNKECIDFGDHCNNINNGFPLCTSLLPQVNMSNVMGNEDDQNGISLKHPNMAYASDQDWETTAVRGSSIGFPFSLPVMSLGGDAWKPNLLWDSSSSSPSDMSTSFSSTKCYT